MTRRFAICVVAVLAVGCGKTSATPSMHGTSVQYGRNTGSLDLPLDWINAEYSRVSFELARAETRLNVACMRSRGFDVSADGLFQIVPGSYTLGRRYSTYSPAVASTRGYQPEQNDPRDRRDLAMPAEGSPARAAFFMALTGSSGLPTDFVNVTDPTTGAVIARVAKAGGCDGVAQTRIYGSFEQYARFTQDDLFIQSLTGEAQATAAVDPEVKKVKHAWSSCMSTSGYHYESPEKPQSDNWPEPRPKKAERDTAVADMKCRDEIGYLPTIAAAERRAQSKIVESKGTLLGEIHTRRNAVVANAEHVGELLRSPRPRV